MEKEKTVVIKIGSALMLDEEKREAIFGVIEEIQQRCRVVIVASGAVGFGRKEGIDTEDKQVLAALGQPTLMAYFKKRFSASQILVNHDDLNGQERKENTRKAILATLDAKIIPVINENDTTSIAELHFGDNDQLAAHVASFLNADQLFMLTGANGVMDADGKNMATLDMNQLSERSISLFEKNCVQEKSAQGRGGIISKIIAAIRANQAGVETFITNGAAPQSLLALADNGKSETATWTQIINQLSDEQIRVLETYIEDTRKKDPNFEVPSWDYTKTK